MHKDETEEEFVGEANALRDDVNRYRSFIEKLHPRYGCEQSKLGKRTLKLIGGSEISFFSSASFIVPKLTISLRRR